MRVTHLVFAVIALALLISAGSAIQSAPQAGDFRERDRLDEQDNDSGGIIGEGVEVFVASDQMQVVAYADEGNTGGDGLLGFQRACAGVFPGSRVCTVSEIHEASYVATPPPGFRYAWVEPHGEDKHSAKLMSVANSRPFAAASLPSSDKTTTDCQGWTDNSAKKVGIAIDLGEDGCFGGFVLVSCAEPRAVACCAPAQPEGFDPWHEVTD